MTTFRSCNITVILAFIGLLVGCATVSFEQPKSYSTAITDTDDTLLGYDAAYKTAQHDNQSGFYLLIQGMDALGIRLRLAEKAEKSIDLQYFLMKNDTAGAVMANALLKAADRGLVIAGHKVGPN